MTRSEPRTCSAPATRTGPRPRPRVRESCGRSTIVDVELLIATANPGKAREFREMLGGGVGRLVWHDLSESPKAEPVEETGRTFRANACLKASAYAKRYRMWALADDSGLEVDALDGSSGVLSARWAQVNGSGNGDRSEE